MLRNRSLFLLFPRGRITRRETIAPNIVLSHCFSTFSFQQSLNKKTVMKSKEQLLQQEPKIEEGVEEEDFVNEPEDSLNKVEVIDFRKKSSGNSKDIKVFQQSSK